MAYGRHLVDQLVGTNRTVLTDELVDELRGVAIKTDTTLSDIAFLQTGVSLTASVLRHVDNELTLIAWDTPPANYKIISYSANDYAGYNFVLSDDDNGDAEGTYEFVTPDIKKLRDDGDVKGFGAKGDGSSDSAAFQKAVNSLTTVKISDCDLYYLVGGLTVPDGVTFIGERKYTYTATTLSAIEGKNAIVYDTNEDTFITWGQGSNIIRCTFHGNDNSRDFVEEGSGLNIYMFQSSVFGCKNGFGKSTGQGNSRLLESHFSGNVNGILGLVDSHVYMCEINANSGSGVVHGAGHNDTVYIGNKVEWNEGKGYEFFGGNTSNQVIGGVVDRNGEAGLSITGDSELIFSNVKMRRNGRLSSANEEQDCHIALRGGVTDKLKISNIQTSYGYDDDGSSGYQSPKNTITSSNTANVIGSLVDSDLRGATAVALNRYSGGTLTVRAYTANNTEDITLNTGGAVVFNAAAANFGFRTFGEREGIVNTGDYTAATDATFSNLPAVSTFSRLYYQLDVLTRNTTTGGTGMQRFMIAASREGADASAVILTIIESAANIPAVTAAFDSAGETLTVTVTPSSDTLNSKVVLSKAE